MKNKIRKEKGDIVFYDMLLVFKYELVVGCFLLIPVFSLGIDIVYLVLLVFYFLLGVFSLSSKIYINEKHIKMKVFKKASRGIFERSQLKELFVVKSKYHSQIFMCFYDVSGSYGRTSLYRYTKLIKSNPNIKSINIIYNKKLFLELAKDRNINVLGERWVHKLLYKKGLRSAIDNS